MIGSPTAECEDTSTWSTLPPICADTTKAVEVKMGALAVALTKGRGCEATYHTSAKPGTVLSFTPAWVKKSQASGEASLVSGPESREDLGLIVDVFDLSGRAYSIQPSQQYVEWQATPERHSMFVTVRPAGTKECPAQVGLNVVVKIPEAAPLTNIEDVSTRVGACSDLKNPTAQAWYSFPAKAGASYRLLSRSRAAQSDSDDGARNAVAESWSSNRLSLPLVIAPDRRSIVPSSLINSDDSPGDTGWGIKTAFECPPAQDGTYYIMVDTTSASQAKRCLTLTMSVEMITSDKDSSALSTRAVPLTEVTGNQT
jgi:hypothetical protein